MTATAVVSVKQLLNSIATSINCVCVSAHHAVAVVDAAAAINEREPATATAQR